MAAGVRSDRRIARIGDTCRTTGRTAGRMASRNASPRMRHDAAAVCCRHVHVKSGRVDLHLSQLAKTYIMVALTGRGPEAASSPSGHEHGDQGPRA